MNMLTDKYKNLFSKKSYLYILLAIGVLVLLSGSFLSSENDHENKKSKEQTLQNANEEERLEKILSGVYGAGETDVMITYDTGVEKVVVENSKLNKSTDGKSVAEGGDTACEISEEREVVMTGSGSTQKPFVSKEVYPRVRGVLIVADGGDNEKVRYELVNAVAAVLDVPYYRIRVLKKSN